MARVPRSHLPDGGFHVFIRGVNHEPIYVDDDDRILFLSQFAAVALRFEWDCYALCLMDTHYHGVLIAKREQLTAGMHRLNGGYAEDFNARYGRVGHLFGDRFVSRVIGDEGYLRTACAYVIANPVRAGLCERPADWRWTFSRYGYDL